MTKRILVVCEKPSVARRIAKALDDNGAPESFSLSGVPYHASQRGKTTLIVVPVLGQMFSISKKGGKWVYPAFEFEWVPSYIVDKKMARTKYFMEVIQELSQGVEGFVSACDHDMEGSLIAYMVLHHVCGEITKMAKRMKYSTLTDRDINRAWDELSDSLDFPLIEAGRSRHEVDWLFGINLTRALTLAVKNTTGFYKVISVGRVQGPTLNFIKKRDVKIQSFVPTPFWIISADIRLGRKKFTLDHESSRLQNETRATEIIKQCKGKEGDLRKLEIDRIKIPTHPPISLGDLQREAYKNFHYSPQTTLRAAERLYLRALISYPRTSSQRIPPSIDLRWILNGLNEQTRYVEFSSRLLGKYFLSPLQGKKDDPAHPAIYPTGKKPGRMKTVDGRVYDLICRRFMASLEDPAVREVTRATINVNGHIFFLKGSRLVERGWVLVYEPFFRAKGVVLPALKIGQKIQIRTIESPRRFTRPPQRLNSGSLLTLMERKGLGTKVTRSDIISTMFKRGYISGREIRLTDLGFTVVDSLERIIPEILSVEMTRKLEDNIEEIRAGETNAMAVVEEAIRVLEPALLKFKQNEASIGTEITKTIIRPTIKGKTLGVCPVCKRGEIRIIVSKTTGKRFAGCTNHFKGGCDTSYPLPQKGTIQAVGRNCTVCGALLIRVIRYYKRPWDLCINFDCPSKRKRS
ncbi:MAG: DNA topoisomerase I [Candidatus Bathyarchaeota archaeon]|nr:DNA topoisomerase I [Candidatus Bathyarchaeota archaeon]